MKKIVIEILDVDYETLKTDMVGMSLIQRLSLYRRLLETIRHGKLLPEEEKQ